MTIIKNIKHIILFFTTTLLLLACAGHKVDRKIGERKTLDRCRRKAY